MNAVLGEAASDSRVRMPVAPAGTSTIPVAFDTAYTWSYDVERADLRQLYEKSKDLQWNARTRLPWDMKYLGMQILVEGLALAAFGFISQTSHEPLIREIVTMIMQDEARHVAFGVLSLRGLYDDMTAAELRDREEFIVEASRLMY